MTCWCNGKQIAFCWTECSQTSPVLLRDSYISKEMNSVIYCVVVIWLPRLSYKIREVVFDDMFHGSIWSMMMNLDGKLIMIKKICFRQPMGVGEQKSLGMWGGWVLMTGCRIGPSTRLSVLGTLLWSQSGGICNWSQIPETCVFVTIVLWHSELFDDMCIACKVCSLGNTKIWNNI
jgi:hypothetical protein